MLKNKKTQFLMIYFKTSKKVIINKLNNFPKRKIKKI